jgi:peptide chain release factor 1
MHFEPLEEKLRRYEELGRLISTPEIIMDPAKCAILAKERGALARMIGDYLEYKKLVKRVEEANAIIKENADPEFVALAKEELASVEKECAQSLERIKDILISESRDSLKNVIMEIRAGTGGDEAAIFAGDLFRMYQKYAESRGWKVEVLDSSPTELGGVKEIIINITGEKVYYYLQYESGGHRVQRVPKTEAQGRIHTSAATVAVLPEAEEVEVVIDPKDVRIDRMRASGPGGQKVNKTSSAIRLTHIPTNIVIHIQDEKSQHKNLSKAYKVLRSRLYEKYEQDKAKTRSDERRTLIGSGDRSERIRTYNYPQNRITDHRINLSVHNLDKVIMGDMGDIITKLLQFDREEKLKNL